MASYHHDLDSIDSLDNIDFQLKLRDRTKFWRIFRELCAQAEKPFLTVRIRLVLKFFRNSDFLLFI